MLTGDSIAMGGAFAPGEAREILGPIIVRDPGIQFGRPTIRGTRILAVVVADLYHAEGGDERAMRMTCRWFRLEPHQVQAAVDHCERFRELARRRWAGRTRA